MLSNKSLSENSCHTNFGRDFMRGLTGLVAATVVSFSGVTSAVADPSELIFNIFIPPNAPIVSEGLIPWAKQVEDASNGTIKMTIPTSSLAPVPRLWDILQDGVVDIIVAPMELREKQMALSTMFNIPMVVGGSVETASVAFWETYQKYFAAADEYKDFLPLSLFVLGGNQFMTTDKKLETIDDFKNVKLRVNGKYPIEMLKSFGAAPVGAPGIQMFELVSTGVVDGTLAQPGPAMVLGLGSVIKEVTTIPGGLFRPAFCICINKESFANLPAEAQAALIDMSGVKLSRALGAISGLEDDIGQKVLTEKGATFTLASDSLLAEIAKRSAFVEQDWLKIAAERGVDGVAALKFFREKSLDK